MLRDGYVARASRELLQAHFLDTLDPEVRNKFDVITFFLIAISLFAQTISMVESLLRPKNLKFIKKMM